MEALYREMKANKWEGKQKKNKWGSYMFLMGINNEQWLRCQTMALRESLRRDRMCVCVAQVWKQKDWIISERN